MARGQERRDRPRARRLTVPSASKRQGRR
jgi:hypothetical protein